MLHVIVTRLLRMLFLVILISIVVFVISHLIPGGPESYLAQNPKVSGADIDRIRSNFGLDKPLAIQYFYWFSRVFLHLDFGISYVTGEPVSEMIIDRIPATIELMGTSFLVALISSIAIGVVWSGKREGLVNEVFSIVSTAGMSIPVFWLGIMLIAVFSVKLGWFPPGGRGIGGMSLIDHIRHLILPAGVLSIAYFATWSRYIRAGMMDAFTKEFIRTARAKGLSERAVIFKHALKNAALPFVTVVMLQAPTVFAGAVVTETVFSWPGMGRLFYTGLLRQDYPRILGVILISSFLVILFNLLADLLTYLIDPRLRSDSDRRYQVKTADLAY